MNSNEKAMSKLEKEFLTAIFDSYWCNGSNSILNRIIIEYLRIKSYHF